MWQSFIIAVQFLTRFPIFSTAEWEPNAVGRSLLFYPVVGLMIGLLLLLVVWLSSAATDLVQAGILLIVWVLITGGLHLDGLADSADAWVGGLGDKERTLEIMKDPYCGPSAVVLLVLVLLLKFSALVGIIAAENWWALLLIPMLSRSTLLALFLTTPYVRPGGLGELLAQYMPRNQLKWLLLGSVLMTWFILGGLGFVMIIVAAIVCFLLRAMMLKRLDGLTGDTAGANVELVEIVLLVVAIA